MENKCFFCPDCRKQLSKKNGGYYCKSCDENFEKRYIEKNGRKEEDADY